MVASTSLPPGAEIMTFFAPASRCAPAFSLLVNKPVHSMTTSTPKSPQGSLAGSRSASTFTESLPTRKLSPSTETSCPNLPCTVSCFSRCALVAASPKSLTATTSKSSDCPDSNIARSKLRPIRPKPLIATLIAIEKSPSIFLKNET